MKYQELFSLAMTGDKSSSIAPYPYQTQIAAEGLPDLIEVETGLGKTEAVVLAWLWRRRFHPDAAVRQETPARLALAFPMRVLVEQTRERLEAMLKRLDLVGDPHITLLMGGEPTWVDRQHWTSRPERDSIVIGTIDMVLSRCLMRGYGSSRGMWPMEFGLLNDDTQFVFDEVQLMGAALPTARQLQGFRDQLNTYRPTRSTFMSATVDLDAMRTVDSTPIQTHVTLSDQDHADPRVAQRLNATKVVQRLNIDDPKKHDATVAQHAASRHRPGTLSLVIANTVERASQIAAQFDRKVPTDAQVVLLHSRFRPSDRKRQVDRATGSTAAKAQGGAGTIIVSTQVVEAGVDISAAVLTTEVAPWSSLVQRAGRCNRAGELSDAEWWWVDLGERQAAPYQATDLAASAVALTEMEGESLSPARLSTMSVNEVRGDHHVIRRKDLYDLFDTSPDGSGNDIDVGRFIRDDVDDLDVTVAWRHGVGTPEQRGAPMPARDERCPVPVREFRKWFSGLDIGQKRRVTRWSVDQRAWVMCQFDDIRPGAVILVDSELGGYTHTTGWTPSSKAPVDPIEPTSDDVQSDEADETSTDPLTMTGDWVTLRDHLADAEREAANLMRQLLAPLPTDHAESVVEAAALHDVGKAHKQFQQAIREVSELLPPDDVQFAKSGGTGKLRYNPRGFRHEFVSALWVLAAAASGSEGLPPITDTDLVAYLVAAHHGKVRVALRGPHEAKGEPNTLGVMQGETVDAFETHAGRLPQLTVDLSLTTVGARAGERSWKERVLGLLYRGDLGPFRLAHLEALVRLADWRASENPTKAEVELRPKPPEDDIEQTPDQPTDLSSEVVTEAEGVLS